MAYSAAWDEALPLGSANASDIDQIFRDTKRDIRERVGGIFGLTALQFAADPIVPISLALSTFLALGTSPASAGLIRVPNNQDAIVARNAANIANIVGLKLDAANVWQVGGSSPIAVAAGNKFYLDGGGDTYIYEGAANRIDLVTGGAAASTFTSAGINSTFTGNLTGNLTGNVTGNLTGTVLTAAQGNITSLGTLVSLTVTGEIVTSDRLRLAGNLVSVATAGTIYRTANIGLVLFPAAGATYDFILTNKLGADVIEVPTGTTNVNIVGALTGVTNITLAAGGTVAATNLSVVATGRVYLDGGGDTYIYEIVANGVQIITGGALAAGFTSTSVTIPATSKFYLDGGGDTYIYEGVANRIDLVTGGATATTFSASGVNSAFTGNLTGNVTGNLTGTILTASQTNITQVGTLLTLGLSPAVGTSAIYTALTNTGGTYYFGVEGSTGGAFGAAAYAAIIYVPGGLAMQIDKTTRLASFAGGISANVAGNLTGTVLTAAQGNITSLGTLTSLSVSGLITATGGARLPNNVQGFVGRNAANSADITIGYVTSTDYVALGVAADTTIGGSAKKIGFFANGGTVKATVTGSRGGNLALQSLLIALAGYGLVTDSST